MKGKLVWILLGVSLSANLFFAGAARWSTGSSGSRSAPTTI